MKPTKKNQWLVIVMTAGLLITHACGSNPSSYGSYKANSAVEGGDPASVTNTANSPAEMNVGDIYTVTFDNKEDGVIDFEGTDSSAQFILAIGSLDTIQTSKTVQLADEGAEMDITEAPEEILGGENWTDISANDALEQRLRGAEMELSLDPDISKASPLINEAAGAMKAMVGASRTVAPAVGDSESFKVLAGLSSLSSYKTIQAKAKCVADNVVFYVDTQVELYNPDDLTDSDVNSLCASFDAVVAEEFDLFGETSDVNDDGRVAVLMTPQVNRLGAMGGGIITGFFFANDLYSGSNSNFREIIYVLVPDSKGTYGVAIPKDFAMDNLLPAVLPHELQHAINYNQKVFESGISAEENWMNEGLSHLAEDLVGFNQENPSRIEVYLNNTGSYGPISAGSPNLAERGASYLFLRYLYEQSANGKEFVWNLLHSDKTGVENLEAAFAGTSSDFDQISEFLLRWASAMVMSSFNLSKDARFSYKERVLNPSTNHYEGVCLDCDTEDGRGTILSGMTLATYYWVSQTSIEATASKFYKVTSFPNKMDISSNSTGSYGATLIRFK
ncbi:MAG: hypothetical protein COV46_08590 [Deltaproteobacteria bacterium CG11_big_fil_rev_8_21_14_0_20_49_13]|nr:MAG: hypothetical protein COV46_08590 [Deltaproteobacteria bacterium CG11_big_fil_rev_8_21_14_0_20_49_13]